MRRLLPLVLLAAAVLSACTAITGVRATCAEFVVSDTVWSVSAAGDSVASPIYVRGCE